MKERPILLNGEMVRAVLDGRKTQTRRPVKPQPPETLNDGRRYADRHNESEQWCWWGKRGTAVHNKCAHHIGTTCPYGEPGDRLWVRETWNVNDVRCTEGNGGGPFEDWGPYEQIPKNCPGRMAWVYYKASDLHPEEPVWRPSIHMPRWASRILLEVVDVRVERLREITDEAARAEGVTYEAAMALAAQYSPDYVLGFMALWNAIYKDRGLSWEADPWVWVVEFRVLKVTR